MTSAPECGVDCQEWFAEEQPEFRLPPVYFAEVYSDPRGEVGAGRPLGRVRGPAALSWEILSRLGSPDHLSRFGAGSQVGVSAGGRTRQDSFREVWVRRDYHESVVIDTHLQFLENFPDGLVDHESVSPDLPPRRSLFRRIFRCFG